MKKIAGLCMYFLLILSAAQAQFAFQPGILHFNASQGEIQTQVVKITNLSSKKMAFNAYFEDWLRDSVGGHLYFRPDTLQQSCASWVSINENVIEVAPNSSKDVIVTLKAPKDPNQFDKMRWAMLFIQTMEEKETGRGKNKEVKTEIKEVVRVGVHIYQTPPKVNQANARVLFFKESAKDKKAYDFGMLNTGDVMLQCRASLTLTNVADGKDHKLEKIEFPVFPNGKRVVSFKIPDYVPKGKYSALAVLDFGEDHDLQAIEKTIELKE